MCGRYPGFHYWEHTDPRLIVCETFLQHNTSNSSYGTNSYPDPPKQSDNISEPVKKTKSFKIIVNLRNKINIKADCLIVSMFFNSDTGILAYDSYARDEIYNKLISIKIPYHFFVTKVKFESKNIFKKSINYIFNFKGRMIETDGQRMVYEGFQVPKLDQNDDSKNTELQVAPNFENFSQTNKVDHSKGKVTIIILNRRSKKLNFCFKLFFSRFHVLFRISRCKSNERLCWHGRR